MVNRARIAISSQIQQNESIRKFVLLSLLKMPPGKLPLNLARIKSSTGPKAAKNTTGAFRTYRGGVALEKAVQGCADFPHFSGEMWQKSSLLTELLWMDANQFAFRESVSVGGIRLANTPALLKIGTNAAFCRQKLTSGTAQFWESSSQKLN